MYQPTKLTKTTQVVKTPRKLNFLLFLFAAVTSVLCAGAGAETQKPLEGILYFVNSGGDASDLLPGDNQCDTDGNGTCTLRAAIEEINARASAMDGISLEVPVVTLTRALPDLITGIEITGFGPDLTTVQRSSDADTTAFRIFNVQSLDTVIISGMTITNGFPGSGVGGGIANGSLGALIVKNCTVASNFAASGGGISNSGAVTIETSTISDNEATGFGEGFGGGIFNEFNATATIRDSVIYGNSCGSTGGGIYNDTNGILSLSNSTVAVNRNLDSTSQTGGILNGGGMFNCSNSTVVLNEDADIRNAGGQAFIRSSIIERDLSTFVNSLGYNLVSVANGYYYNQPTDQVGLDQKLDPNGLQDNGGPTLTIALLPDSPAIDKGTADETLTNDQRGAGFPRTIDDPSIPNADDGTDVGAYERDLGPQLTVLDAVSRKTHGKAIQFDINLPLTGTAGIECRTGGDSGLHQVIVTFSSPVTVTSANATPDPNAPGATASVSDFTVNGSEVTVNLTNVSNAQTILITLSGVSDGTNTIDVAVSMGVLLGDTIANGSVEYSDYALVKSERGQRADSSNFREDVTVNGFIGGNDARTVRSKKFTSLP